MLDINAKATFGVSLISSLLVLPFSINNFTCGRVALGNLTAIVTIVCALNAWMCYRNKYSFLFNLFVISPIIMGGISLAVYRLGVAGSYWFFMGVFALYFILPISYAWLANVVFFLIDVPIGWMVLDSSVAMRFSAVALGTSAFAFASMAQIHKLYERTRKQAVLDPLTGLYNRALLPSSLDEAISMHDRTGTPVSLLMLDIDFFKKINDSYGHDIGDVILKKIADFLKLNLRSNDKIFRIGGEEFLAIMYGVDSKAGFQVAEKLRLGIRENISLPQGELTASFGVVSLVDDMDGDEWLKRCDQLLYQAKSGGRDRVCCNPDVEPEMKMKASAL